MLITFGIIIVVLVIIKMARRSAFDSITYEVADRPQQEIIAQPMARYRGEIITDEARVREIMSAEDYATATVNGTQPLEALPKLTIGDGIAIVQYSDHQQVIRVDQNSLVVVESKYGSPTARQVILDLPAILEILWKFKLIERIE